LALSTPRPGCWSGCRCRRWPERPADHARGRLRAHRAIRPQLQVWSDHLLSLGGPWINDISDAISDSTALVLLASPEGITSKWVMREASAAQASGIPIVPMLTGGARYSDLPTYLAGINGVDLDEDYHDALSKVVLALTRPIPSAEPPGAEQAPSGLPQHRTTDGPLRAQRPHRWRPRWIART
jgi:hypothetical protein